MPATDDAGYRLEVWETNLVIPTYPDVTKLCWSTAGLVTCDGIHQVCADVRQA